MDHADHVMLLRDAVARGGTWADIGAGTGAFTLALADLLGPTGRIVAVDRVAAALDQAAAAVTDRFQGIDIATLVADFTEPIDLPTLDGLIAANSLHFVPSDLQVGVIQDLSKHLRPGGRFVIVEYDAQTGNPWVPYPFRLERWTDLATAAGLVDARPLERAPTRFLGGIYSAMASRA